MELNYPLQWPQGRPRTKERRRATFNRDGSRLSVADARRRLREEMGRLNDTSDTYVLSTDLPTRADGEPMSGRREPDDPGVCVYFKLKGKPIALPCDTYDRIADNIAAIAAHIEKTRAIERYGVATIAEMFTGFAALPAPGAKKPWREVLGVPTDWHGTSTDIETHWRAAAKNAHPDRPGGSHDRMTEVNRARDEALKELT